MNKLFLFVFFIFILSLSLVSPQLEIERDGVILSRTKDISGVSIEVPPTPEADLNVNSSNFSSTADFWDLLDDPSDLLLSQFSATWVDTTFNFNSQSATNLAGLTLTNDITLNPFNWLVPTPILPNHTTNKDYVDDATSSTAFDFFFDNETSNIAGFFNMTEGDLDRAESSLDSSSLGQGVFQIFNWSTAVGQPEFNELRQGVYDVHVHLEIDGAGRKPVTITPKLYNISSDGSIRNLLVTFETSDTLTASGIEYDLHGVLSSPVMLEDGDRLNLELEATVGASGANPVVTITMEGITDSHLSIQTSTNAFEKIFIRRDGTTDLTGNWNYGNFYINGSGDINTTGDLSVGHLITLGDETNTDIILRFTDAGSDADLTYKPAQGQFDFGGKTIITQGTISATNNIGSGAEISANNYIASSDIAIGGATPLTLSAGSITDFSGVINFNNENLTSTGNATFNYFFGNGSQLTDLTESQIIDLTHTGNASWNESFADKKYIQNNTKGGYVGLFEDLNSTRNTWLNNTILFGNNTQVIITDSIHLNFTTTIGQSQTIPMIKSNVGSALGTENLILKSPSASVTLKWEANANGVGVIARYTDATGQLLFDNTGTETPNVKFALPVAFDKPVTFNVGPITLPDTIVTGDDAEGTSGADANPTIDATGGEGADINGGPLGGTGGGYNFTGGMGGEVFAIGQSPAVGGTGGAFEIHTGDGGPATVGGGAGDGGSGGDIIFTLGSGGAGISGGSAGPDGQMFIGSSPSANATLLTVFGNITASNFIDLTPNTLLSSEDSFNAIVNIQSTNGELNHSTLPDLAKASMTWKEKVNCRIIEIEIVEEVCTPQGIGDNEIICKNETRIQQQNRCDTIYHVEEARSLGGMITEIVNAFKDIANRLTGAEERINTLETELCKKDNSYKFCV